MGRVQEETSLPNSFWMCILPLWKKHWPLLINMPSQGIFFLTFEISASATKQWHQQTFSVQPKLGITNKYLICTSRKRQFFKHTQKHKSSLRHNLHFFRKSNTAPHYISISKEIRLNIVQLILQKHLLWQQDRTRVFSPCPWYGKLSTQGLLAVKKKNKQYKDRFSSKKYNRTEHIQVTKVPSGQKDDAPQCPGGTLNILWRTGLR